MQQTYEDNLSREELQKLRNNRTGITIFQISWIMVFVCLVVVNLQIRSGFETWPPDGVQRLGTVIPTFATLALIVSSVTAHRALGGIKRDDRAQFLSNWRITMGLGVLFILIMAFEWLTVPVSGQYSTVFRVMTAFHGVHALAIGWFLLNAHQNVDRFNTTYHWDVEASTRLWDFVTIAWLLFYVVLYII